MIKRFDFKPPGRKMIRLTADVEGDMIKSIRINGDFFIFPEEAIDILEKNLTGIKLDDASVKKAVGKFYDKAQTPGTIPDDFVAAVLSLRGV